MPFNVRRLGSIDRDRQQPFPVSLSLSLSSTPSTPLPDARLAFTTDGFARNLESRQDVVSHDRRGRMPWEDAVGGILNGAGL